MKNSLMIIISSNKPLYPKQLKRLYTPPKQLYIESKNWEAIVNMPMLAVVGTRRPSSYATHECARIVREIASRGVCIVGGLALGIDGIAHRAALESGGVTIAVLPAGLEHVYPSSHRQLANDIITNGGALITEHPPHAKIAYKGNFVARNRIVAGLSAAVFIPEATEKSGSLHTAQFAIESGIDVCAMPGQISNPQSAGCHHLIQAGAGLITSSDDIANIIGITAHPHSAQVTATTPEEARILTCIGKGIHDANDIQIASKLPVTQFQQTLTMLEISGKIKAGGANSWYIT